MAWDQNRPVPWRRLVREWLIYVGIMAVILVVLFRDSGFVGAISGLLVSGPLYLVFGYVMAKFGYQRKSLKDLKTPRSSSKSGASTDSSDSDSDSGESADRSRPLPTKRTSGGGNRPKSKPRRR